MTIDDFRDLLLTADPAATKWQGAGTGTRTVWHPYRFRPLAGDNDQSESVTRIQVDRFTKIDKDATADAVTAALRSRPDEIAFEHLLDYEPDTGLLHHIWDVEVV